MPNSYKTRAPLYFRFPSPTRLVHPGLLASLLAACTGLTAGPEVSARASAPVSRDSAWVRAKRALQTESFTLDVQDSLTGRLVGLRYPSPTATPGTVSTCRVQLALQVSSAADASEIASTSRWIAPVRMAETKSPLCERERQETLERIQQVIVPPAQ